jgi:hypothetical protein
MKTHRRQWHISVVLFATLNDAIQHLSESSSGRTGSCLQVNVPEGDEGAQRYTSLV